MLRTNRATWILLVPMAVLGLLHGPGCSNEAEDIDRNGESTALKGECKLAADDGDPCTVEGCEGQPNAHVKVAGLPCGTNNALKCNANGQCSGCTSPDQCGESADCAPYACNSGVCNLTFTPSGTPVPAQVPGDCQQIQCDGNGEEMSANDDSDVPSTACQLSSCVGGTPTSMPAAQGTPCSVGNGKSCDGEGNCVECNTDADCGVAGIHCDPKSNTCFSCTDGIRNGDESDSDCGGNRCPKCTQGKSCNTGGDCTTANCADGACCSSPCSGPCLACDLPGFVGECNPIEKYGEDSSYGNGMSCLNAAGLACSAAASCLQALNTNCASNGDCASLRCADPDNNGQKTCVKGPGDPCNQPVECFNNTCTNGVCAP
ncbi:hypothetical protein [Polyangium mundeleinium]|uniref:Tryptophan synthase alpha chain n=1 Tax=Polyangium mundeleinium TaxID=2995306 RepID=A0ABT5EYI9_9BACT|nr:hypothetical protein [Polyangium mundeleinium]MDC0746893.1 hypothetical protein [Polyangium mundeleinium]